MPTISTDIERILHEEVEDEDLRMLLHEILDWEGEKLHKTIRHTKKDALNKRITEHLNDQ